MVEPSEFFGPWEPEPVQSLTEFLDLIKRTFSRWSGRTVRYAWRGVVNSNWPLHSALYRRMTWTYPARTDEASLARLEADVLADAHRWGLHYMDRAHLPVLYEMAMLQHFGTPTRLLDITFNPLIALYFAVEDQRDDHGQPLHAGSDGRLFIFDVSSRLINESTREERQWEEAFARPWSEAPSPDWRKRTWAWRPAPIEARFAAQGGGFIFGGVPIAAAGAWRKAPMAGSGHWHIDEVRSCTSIPVRFNKLVPGSPGRPPDNPTFTVRVAAAFKKQIREDLRRWFDIESRTVYPDHPGFAMNGTPDLRRRP